MAEYEFPSQCLYTREDEWIRIEEDRVVVGISDYAQQQLGDVVFLELPKADEKIRQGEPFGVIESVKAVSDLCAPISGDVLESNTALEDPNTGGTPSLSRSRLEPRRVACKIPGA